MGYSALIVGESGSGKSTSLQSMVTDRNDAFIINVFDKELPFRNKIKKIILQRPDGLENENIPDAKIYGKILEAVKGNEDARILVSEDSVIIKNFIEYINKERPEIKKIVIDDWQYASASYYMKKANAKGYDKFTKMAKDIWDVGRSAKGLREDLIIYLFSHLEEFRDSDNIRRVKAKTLGKMVDNAITLEGMFTTVLYAETEITSEKKVRHYFRTVTSGYDTCKSPVGMFDNEKIPNNLQLVDDSIRKFYYLSSVNHEPQQTDSIKPKN
jgi:hypothetical protein